jgi:enterochelin esterase-like enzyme
MNEKTGAKSFERVGLGVFLALCLLGALQALRYFSLALADMALTILVLELLMLLLAWAAWRSRMPFLLLGVAVGGFVLNSFLNYGETTSFAVFVLLQALLAAAWAILGTVWMLVKKLRPGRLSWLPLALMLAAVLCVCWVWKTQTDADRQWQGHARRALWAVPEKFDSGEIAEAGTLEELVYETKAYATDGRAVTKRAMVYLPYGYSADKKYNILYLMHGTGDDEYYWLKTHAYNKIMLDRLIAMGEIEPLIVVTPTFYVENDCMDGLDALTFSFREELRNDLMPAVEEKYSTWAETADDKGFSASRDHRAFAGLSRGAVTTANSVLCGSLDYFSYFGLFSSFRTTEEHIRETMLTEEQRNLPIHYVYATTGNFDFATPYMTPGYTMLNDLEPRLDYGINTSYDIFPMRYHSIGHWHLSLYNFLQKVFSAEVSQ